MIHFLKGKFWYIFSLFLIQSALHAEKISPSVIVSVAPHKFFVNQIAKEKVDVILMVPAGASSHTYEPTPRQMIEAGKAKIWFRIGESFENRAIQALKSHHSDIEIVDMRKGLDLICDRVCCCSKEGADLHFWLSARQGEIQAKTIAEALIQAFPEHKEFFQSNLEIFIQKLKDLDQKIEQILAPLKNRAIFVSHPAYAYFCRDYQLQQYSIEMEGKDPTPQQTTKLLKLMRDLKASTIFIQMQYNNKAAKLIADTLDAKLVILDPYSEHYIASMLEIANAFSKQ